MIDVKPRAISADACTFFANCAEVVSREAESYSADRETAPGAAPPSEALAASAAAAKETRSNVAMLQPPRAPHYATGKRRPKLMAEPADADAAAVSGSSAGGEAALRALAGCSLHGRTAHAESLPSRLLAAVAESATDVCCVMIPAQCSSRHVSAAPVT